MPNLRVKPDEVLKTVGVALFPSQIAAIKHEAEHDGNNFSAAVRVVVDRGLKHPTEAPHADQAN